MPLGRTAALNALEAALGKSVDRAVAEGWFAQIDTAWPSVSADSAAFGKRLGLAAKSAGTGRLEVADFFLAHACLEGNSAALTAFDDLLGDVTEILTRQTSADLAQEAVQQVRYRLLVPAGENSEARLFQYSGQGHLFGFLRSSAVNSLRNVLSAENRNARDGDDALADLADTADLEARLVRADQQAHFRRAFRGAVKSLTPRDRALLRFSLLDGLSIDELAPMYKVHRSSLARWLVEARETLAQRTRTELADLLGLPALEIEALLNSVQGQFDLSLSRVLRETNTGS